MPYDPMTDKFTLLVSAVDDIQKNRQELLIAAQKNVTALIKQCWDTNQPIQSIWAAIFSDEKVITWIATGSIGDAYRKQIIATHAGHILRRYLLRAINGN